MCSVDTFDVRGFAATPSAPTVTTADAGVWTMTVVAQAQLADTDSISLDDDIVAAPITIALDTAGDGDGGDDYAIDLSLATDAESVRDAMLADILTIIATESLAMTAEASSTDKIIFTMTTPTAGAIAESVTDAGFTVSQAAAGATTRAYKIVGVYESGRVTAASSAGSATDGAAALNATHTQVVTWTDPLDASATDTLVSVRVYRTTANGTPNTTGLVATIAAGVQTYTDDGDAGDATTAPTSNTTGDGDSMNTLAMTQKTVQLTAVGTGTYQLQGSLDGTNWVSEGSALTASSTALLEVSERYAFMRWKTTAYTSGTPVAYIASGRD